MALATSARRGAPAHKPADTQHVPDPSRRIVNRLDKLRLVPHVAAAGGMAPAARLRSLLDAARAVEPHEIPPDVVTMNSRVLVKYGSGEPESFVLVYPDAPAADGVSVLSPLGVALLSARQGQRLTWADTRLSRVVTIERIEYQPEREGHFDR
jgi:regulator of nucleoside diphosphate kinase